MTKSTALKRTKVKVDDLADRLKSDFSTELENQELAIVTRSKAKVEQEFVLMFVENVQTVVHDLTKNEFLVLLSIVKFSQYKNVYNVTQGKIADDSGIAQSQVSRAMKRLKEKNFLIEKDGLQYVNPFLFIKGGITTLKKDKAGALAAVNQLELFNSSIARTF
jgi:predicted transcriptional regulator